MQLYNSFENIPLQIEKHGLPYHFRIKGIFARLHLLVMQIYRVINNGFMLWCVRKLVEKTNNQPNQPLSPECRVDSKFCLKTDSVIVVSRVCVVAKA